MPFKANFARMKDGRPKRFWIEVGAHAWENLQFSPGFAKSEDDFLISFEPLLDKYAMLLARYEGDVTERRPLGFQHKRGLAFPFAVGCETRYTSFTATDYDMCSTVLPTADESSPGFWPPNCLSGAERRTVPCISLRHVLESWLSGQEVYFLKIDAQGYDLNVVQSAGPLLRK
ncbi:Ccdc108, partial [Symbiodinium pilosum]